MTNYNQSVTHPLLLERQIVLGFNNMSTLVGHFGRLPEKGWKEIKKIVEERKDSRGDEREGQGRKRNRKK